MKINVILITYNQEQFIQHAVEGILMQRFNGEIEVIVADDCSKDNTLAIIKSFENKSSFPFRYLDSSSNIGIKQNFRRSFETCDGDYIAVLEGDDYWCNPYRLQKHVDFLNEHRECVMSWNPYIVFNNDSRLFETPQSHKGLVRYVSFSDLLLSNWVGNYSSCVFRKSAYDNINPRLYDVKVEVLDEWLLGLELTKHGLAALFDQSMTVYRKNTGIWGKLTEQQMIEKCIHRIKLYDEYFDFKYSESFTSHRKRLENELKIQKEEKLKLKTPPILSFFKDILSNLIRLFKWMFFLFIPVSHKMKLKARFTRL